MSTENGPNREKSIWLKYVATRNTFAMECKVVINGLILHCIGVRALRKISTPKLDGPSKLKTKGILLHFLFPLI
jgi:hypothetical protein